VTYRLEQFDVRNSGFQNFQCTLPRSDRNYHCFTDSPEEEKLLTDISRNGLCTSLRLAKVNVQNRNTGVSC
jgi:hypothetical protein